MTLRNFNVMRYHSCGGDVVVGCDYKDPTIRMVALRYEYEEKGFLWFKKKTGSLRVYAPFSEDLDALIELYYFVSRKVNLDLYPELRHFDHQFFLDLKADILGKEAASKAALEAEVRDFSEFKEKHT